MAGGDIAVGINKPANGGIVVAGVEVVKAGFGVVVIFRGVDGGYAYIPKGAIMILSNFSNISNKPVKLR